MSITWPIIVLSSGNDLLHLAKDLPSLQDHLYGHARRDQPVGTALEYFDSDCRSLQPQLGLGVLPISFHDTGYTLDEAILLSRIRAVVGKGVAYATSAGVEHPLNQVLETTTSVATYARTLVDDPAYSGRPGTDEVGSLGPGGWLHNAIHAAFGK